MLSNLPGYRADVLFLSPKRCHAQTADVMAGLAADAAVCLCAPQLSVWSPVSNGLAGSVF